MGDDVLVSGESRELRRLDSCSHQYCVLRSALPRLASLRVYTVLALPTITACQLLLFVLLSATSLLQPPFHCLRNKCNLYSIWNGLENMACKDSGQL